MKSREASHDTIRTEAGVVATLVDGDPADDLGLACEAGDQLSCGKSLYATMADSWAKPKLHPEFDEKFYAAPLVDGVISAEYGIGAGRLVAKLKPTYGIDSTPEMVAQCEQIECSTRLLVGDIAHIVLPQRVAYSFAAGGTMNNFLSIDGMTAAVVNILRNSTDRTELRFDLIAGPMYEAGLIGLLNKWFTLPDGGAPHTRERYTRTSARGYLHEYVMHSEHGAPEYAHIHEFWFPPEEVLQALGQAGFSSQSVQSSPNGPGFNPKAHQHFYTARR